MTKNTYATRKSTAAGKAETLRRREIRRFKARQVAANAVGRNA